MTPPTTTGSGWGMASEYPENQGEFEKWFRTDDDCKEYLSRVRWPTGFVCRACEANQAWRMQDGGYRCKACRRDTSLTAGTLFQDSRKPLLFWFRALWHVTSQKNGASALGLQRALGLGSYTTAWLWLHKLRRAMVRPNRDCLSGKVEVDETYVGGEVTGLRGRSGAGKSLVAIAVQAKGAAIGRIRMQVIPDASKATLHTFVRQTVEAGSTVHTDGWDSYKGLDAWGYQHCISTLKGRGSSAATELLPRVHLIAALLKRWLLGTHQGAVSPAHLDYYLDEFTFRFNRRTSASRGLLFFRLVQQSLAVEPVIAATIFGGKKLSPPL
jgi:transposase-like protein